VVERLASLSDLGCPGETDPLPNLDSLIRIDQTDHIMVDRKTIN
jgi:hypothetical protein